MDFDMDIDVNDIAVYDWRNGGMPVPLNTPQKYIPAATPSKSSSRYRADDYHFGSATKPTALYTDEHHYASYYDSSGYASASTSHYQYQHNYGSSSSAQNRDKRTETAVSGASDKDYLFDLDNIEEIDYSDKAAALNPDGTDDVEEIDYSNFSLDNVEEIDYSKAIVPSTPSPPPPILSANGVEIVNTPAKVSTGLVVPKPSLPLKESISDDGVFKSTNGTLSKQSASLGRKRKREECERGQTQEENELVDLLSKSNFRVSSRMYAKPARKASNDPNTSHDRTSEDGCPSASSSFSNVSMNESYDANGKNCNTEETEPLNSLEYPECPLLMIRNDIFEDDEEED
ncbi:hypothetical protein Ocin01_02815 [Orchesella cincta]|uniref:Uncharacterized protein n=1 Tax=Orchesella cincta TaxID=48709 RepID=A0A1D2NF70_ORCCI|nr:hypothetical protein Ocin01_02815 [Orchesella cincta]